MVVGDKGFEELVDYIQNGESEDLQRLRNEGCMFISALVRGLCIEADPSKFYWGFFSND